MPNTPRLVVESARRAFGERVALNGVGLALAPGEIYALLGRNGAGKTTLVRAICGRVRLDHGAVRLDGRDLRQDAAARRDLGLVPQELALYNDLTATENLVVLGRLAGLGRREALTAASRALDWIGLADRAQSRVSTLSGGMKRRVNLAAGVLHRPSVLLLDEPTVGVDPQARERIHDLLRDLRGQGMTILLTTHDLDQAAGLADRIGILDEGQLRAEGSLGALVDQVFGAARQVVLALASPPAEGAAALLETLGLTPSDASGRRFGGGIGGGLDELSMLAARLSAAGLHVTELTVREPDLYSVFFHVTGKDLVE